MISEKNFSCENFIKNSKFYAYFIRVFSVDALIVQHCLRGARIETSSWYGLLKPCPNSA